jgi:protein SCO1/2
MTKSLKTALIATWIITGLVVTGVSAAAWWMRDFKAAPAKTAAVDPGAPRGLPSKLFDTPSFSLTDQDGRPFGSKDLAGKVYVADFIFTHCPSLCPVMTQNMHDIQASTAKLPVQLVSFTVDPERDTPAVLRQYAVDHHADEARWHFLTADRKTMWDLSVGMKLAVDKGDSAMEVMHSSHFLLVDGRGQVRGVYDYRNDGAIKNLLIDADALVAAGGQ